MVKVSIATLDDLDEIADIYHQTSLLHHQELPNIFKSPQLQDEKDFLKTCFKDKDLTIFKAEDNGTMCGYLILRIKSFPKKFFISPKKGFVDSIGVDVAYRGKGIGQQMIKTAENHLKMQNIHSIDIDVYLFNDAATALYEKMGYKTSMLYKSKNF